MRTLNTLFLVVVLTACGACKRDRQEDLKLFNDVMVPALLKHDLQAYDTDKEVIELQGCSIPLGSINSSLLLGIKNNLMRSAPEKAQLIEILISSEIQKCWSDGDIDGLTIEGRAGIQSKRKKLGLIKLSQVSFLKTNSNRGVFFYEFICGPECGSGNVVFVEKIGSNWRIDEIIPLYVM